MPDTTYNGWANYQTWNVMLWMDNEESAYREYREVASRLKSKGRRLGGVAAKSICERCFGDATPDGVKFESSRIRWGAIASAMREE